MGVYSRFEECRLNNFIRPTTIRIRLVEYEFISLDPLNLAQTKAPPKDSKKKDLSIYPAINPAQGSSAGHAMKNLRAHVHVPWLSSCPGRLLEGRFQVPNNNFIK